MGSGDCPQGSREGTRRTWWKEILTFGHLELSHGDKLDGLATHWDSNKDSPSDSNLRLKHVNKGSTDSHLSGCDMTISVNRITSCGISSFQISSVGTVNRTLISYFRFSIQWFLWNENSEVTVERMFQFEEGMNVSIQRQHTKSIHNQIIIYNLLYCVYYVGCWVGKSELKSDKFHYFDYFGFSKFASLNYRNLCFQIQKNSKIIFEKLPLQTKSLLLVTKVHFNTVKYILEIRLKDIVYAYIPGYRYPH